MKARASGGLVLAIFGFSAAGTARAETLVTSLSSERIAITSNFTGADLALFGVIEREPAAPARASGYDVVVTVRGPRGSVSVRRKRPIGPFWITADQRKYIAVPSFIEILASRALEKIAPADVRDEFRLGIEPLVPAQTAKDRVVDTEEPSFRTALIRLRTEQHLFREVVPGVQFVSPSLFRAAIQVPGVAPLGTYDIEVVLFSEAAPLAKTALKFVVTKSGVEQTLADAARERPLAYGLVTASLAMFVGWLATVIFRRD